MNQAENKTLDTPAADNPSFKEKLSSLEGENTDDYFTAEEIEYLRHFPLVYRTENGEFAEFWVDDLFDDDAR